MLPYQKKYRELLVKRDSVSEFGVSPSERSVDELIHSGVINLNKPSGPTSHQATDYVKKMFGLNKAGHSGTLDPAVTGVLPIALEKNTRIVQYLLNAGKEYVGLMHLHRDISGEKILSEIENFKGIISQLPPVKSAVKRAWRKREIYYFDVIEIHGRDVLFKVGCQAGTYIRKLCLHPKTDIICKNGFNLMEYFYLNPQAVYSVNKNKILGKFPTHVQKIKSPNKLIKIKTSSGINIITTPDHELLVSTEEGYKMIESGKLKLGDYLVKSLKIPLYDREIITSDLLDDEYLIAQPKIKQKCKEAFIKKYGSIREANRKTGLDRKTFLTKSSNAITIKHLKLAGIYNDIKRDIHSFKTQKGKIITIKELIPEHFYLLGLIASDGNNTKEKNTKRYTRLKFHNMEETLIDKFREIYQKLFPTIPISKKKVQNNLFQLDTSNSLFATIAASFGITSPQFNTDILPILNCKPEFIKSFLKGYFDGDGTTYFKKKTNTKGHYSNIRIYCCNYINIKRIHQMLLKLGIFNKIGTTNSSFGHMYMVEVSDLESKQKFIKEIGTNHPRKKSYFNEIIKLKFDSKDNYLYIGFHFKNYIGKNRKKLNKIGGNLNRILNSRIPMTRGFYKRCSKIIHLPKLDNFIIEKIVDVKFIKKDIEYVYDMTIPKTHNFLIETGFVSSNCHDFGLALGCNAHMGSLVRTRVGEFTDLNWCSLHDLKDAYEDFKEANSSKLKKLIFPVEKAVAHLGKVYVSDKSIKSLIHGSNLFVGGIVKLESNIEKKETVAVMTLKGELICVGEAVMDSAEMMKLEKGLAVNCKKVFMKIEK